MEIEKKSVTKMFIYVATSRVKNRQKINLNLCRRRNALEEKKTNIYTHTHTHTLITIQILTITKSETNGVT